MKTIDMTPTWNAAVRIYCAVLQNPDAKPSTKWEAEQDLIKLANAMDSIKAEKENPGDTCPRCKKKTFCKVSTGGAECNSCGFGKLSSEQLERTLENSENDSWFVNFAGGEYEIAHCRERSPSWAVVRLNDMAESERYYSWPNGAFTALASGAIKWRK